MGPTEPKACKSSDLLGARAVAEPITDGAHMGGTPNSHNHLPEPHLGGQSLVFPLPLGCEGALSCRKQAIADHHALTPRIHTSREFLEDPGAGGALELPQTRT